VHHYGNFYLPVMKLERKSRVGSRVIRVHDRPQTPYARVLASPDVGKEHKDQLREAYQLLDLLDLRQQISRLQDQLLSTVSAL
jgi:hypothetical protein